MSARSDATIIEDVKKKILAGRWQQSVAIASRGGGPIEALAFSAATSDAAAAGEGITTDLAKAMLATSAQSGPDTVTVFDDVGRVIAVLRIERDAIGRVVSVTP